MELQKILHTRRSCRRYKKDKVKREDLEDLIRCALLAPNSCNLKTIKYVVIDDLVLLSKLEKEVSYKFAYAPAYIIIINDPRFTIERGSGVMSAGMSVEHILLRAVDLGLATCPFAGFSKDEKIKQILQIPAEMELLLLISVGYPDWPENLGEIYTPETNEVMSFNAYGMLHSIKTDEKVSDWTILELIDYRSRISSVYLDRFRLHTYRDEYYEHAVNFLISHSDVKELRTQKILDVMTYDGFFIKTLIEKVGGIDTTVSDYLTRTVDFLTKYFDIKGAVIGTSNTFTSLEDNSFDLLTFIFQIDFTPLRKELLSDMQRILAPNGKLMVSFVEEKKSKQLIKYLKKLYKKYFKRKELNVYEGNPFYKIGPKDSLTENEVIELLASAGFVLKDKKSEPRFKEGVVIHYFIFDKSPNLR